MRVTYDSEAAAAYVYLLEPDGRRLVTEELGSGVLIDRDEEGEIMGIELLNVPGGGIELNLPAAE